MTKHLLAVLLALLLGGTSSPAYAASIIGSLSAAGPTLSTCSNTGDGVATIELSGTWTGTITPNASLAQAAWTALTPYAYGAATSTTITANGLYQVPLSGGACIQLSGAALTGTASVRLTTAPGTLARKATTGTVTAVTGSGNIASSGGTAPNITLTGVVPIANGGTGSNTQNFVSSVTGGGNISSSGGNNPNITFSGLLPLASGGTGTATPALLAGNGLGVSGTFPAQTFSLSAPVSIANGGTGSTTQNFLTSATGSGNIASSGGLTPNLTFTGLLPLANGGTATATPALLAGTGLSVAGTFPAQTFSLSTPVSVANGGTNATTLATEPFAVLSPASQQAGTLSVNGPVTLGAAGNYTLATTNGIFMGTGTAGGAQSLLSTAGTNPAAGVTGNLFAFVLSGSQVYDAMDTSGNFGNLGSVNVGVHLNQSAASQFAKRVALVAGSTTFTFPTAYNSVPVCVASPEGTLALGLISVAPSTSSCIVTSAVGTDTRTVNIIAIGNPN
jgi:hypothetical protein